MEYLHRLLQGLHLNPNFNFHPKCEKLRIINLCFADDILVFTRGDLESVKLVMDRFRIFANTIELNISNPKSKLYLGGVDMDTKTIMQQVTGFELGSLHFKYIGVPLHSKKLSIANFQPLIEKKFLREFNIGVPDCCHMLTDYN
ncbi:unnamed protein product [Lathyrus sativus]|nr:unnamed protein product [Lathyrus sativus]